MPIIYTEMQVAGFRSACTTVTYSFDQGTDYVGRPNTGVHIGLIKVTLTGDPATWPIWVWMALDHYRRDSGHILFYHEEGQIAKRLTFYDAACVHHELRFDARGQGKGPSLEVEIHFSAAAVDVDGQYIEAHSRIPWPTDQVTRFRALTKPQDPLPSLQLRATPSLLAVPTPPLKPFLRVPAPESPPPISIIGRTGKQEQLLDLLNNDKVSSPIKGWITQDLNEIERGKRRNIRNPPGMDLAHERGREAAKGYSYQYSQLQDRDLHRRQHKFDDKGRRNRERPDPALDPTAL